MKTENKTATDIAQWHIERKNRLTDAAPDLLAALADIVFLIEEQPDAELRYREYIARARAALAKAKGQP